MSGPAVSGWLRPGEAAAYARVSRGTLVSWARAGLIGVSRPSARITLYRASDIAALLDHHSTVPRSRGVSAHPAAAGTGHGSYCWQDDPIWHGGTTAAPVAAPAARRTKRPRASR